MSLDLVAVTTGGDVPVRPADRAEPLMTTTRQYQDLAAATPERRHEMVTAWLGLAGIDPASVSTVRLERAVRHLPPQGTPGSRGPARRSWRSRRERAAGSSLRRAALAVDHALLAPGPAHRLLEVRTLLALVIGLRLVTRDWTVVADRPAALTDHANVMGWLHLTPPAWLLVAVQVAGLVGWRSWSPAVGPRSGSRSPGARSPRSRPCGEAREKSCTTTS
ncbi:hypothetical protein NKG05_13570 [Oerskovia sp. M15]